MFPELQMSQLSTLVKKTWHGLPSLRIKDGTSNTRFLFFGKSVFFLNQNTLKCIFGNKSNDFIHTCYENTFKCETVLRSNRIEEKWKQNRRC